MDSFGFSNIHIEKTNAISHYQIQKKIASLFRLIEIILFLAAVSSFTTHIPASFTISGEYFRSLLGNPQIVFLIGNVIILVLFTNSGFFSNSNMKIDGTIGTDFCHGYVKISEKNVRFNQLRKQSSFDEKTERKRTLSEKITKRVDGEKTGRQLRRSATENGRRVKCVEEEMSGEEFRRTVEDFIARQQRFLREEFPAVISDE